MAKVCAFIYIKLCGLAHFTTAILHNILNNNKMKKTFYYLFAFLLAYSLCVGFVSCSNDDDDTPESGQNNDQSSTGGNNGNSEDDDKKNENDSLPDMQDILRAYTVHVDNPDDSVLFKMVFVEGGTFKMGSNNGDWDERPEHSVTLDSYYIGQTEVTQKLWRIVMGNNPSYFKGDDLPVERVSWYACQDFIAKLNKITGENFRLPTEAEWEFAARGGVKSKGYTYSGSNNIDDVAWYYRNSNNRSHPVASKLPNELGIYDMSGNVSEWCQDLFRFYPGYTLSNYDPADEKFSHRIHRGSGWEYGDFSSRPESRFWGDPAYTDSIYGVRLAL